MLKGISQKQELQDTKAEILVSSYLNGLFMEIIERRTAVMLILFENVYRKLIFVIQIVLEFNLNFLLIFQ